MSCNRLTLAGYGEGATLTTHKERYTERFSSFMPNGGIRPLQRHGLKADGNYGKIDNLHISYDGNRITTVLEDADAVTQSGSMDYPGTKRDMAFEYNAWGALIKDESRGIESIEYDNFGNPVHIDMKGRDYTKNVYLAAGAKLKTEHYTDPFIVGPPAIGGTQLADAEPMDMEAVTGIIDPGVSQLAGQEKIEYRGPVIYRNGKIDMVLFPGGYATISGSTVTFHYYTQDYLGSNRAVVNGSTGAVEQTIAYYPYGGIIADLGSGNFLQPFLFGGKELISANGIHEYDLGARRYWTGAPQFTTIDKLCEEFYWLSPYLYCGNNPVNAVDRDGNFFDTIWDIGNIAYDVGAAIVNHVKGDHTAAASNWMDAAFDTAAALVPFAPAGASKIGKAAKAIDKTSDAQKTIKGAEKTARSQESKSLIQNGRSGRQARLKELGNDPKLGKADKGCLKQEQNRIKQGKRSSIRNPRGEVLAHPRGKEAAKGFSYKESKLQLESNHKLQHKHDNNGKKYKNKEIGD